MYTVIASDVFKHSLNRLYSFLSKKYGEDVAREQKKALQSNINSKLCANPHIAPVSDRLLSLGMPEYRQWCTDEHNILYFKINEKTNQIELLAVMDSRQSTQKLLFEIMLLV
jgi:toxin ParE1/3/4